MKQYSAPQVKDVVLHTEHVMLDASKGNGSMTPAQQHTTESSLATTFGTTAKKDNKNIARYQRILTRNT